MWAIESETKCAPGHTKPVFKPFPFATALCLLQLLAFWAGNILQFSNGFSAFWAPTGVGLAALLLAPLRWWPAILLWLTVVDTTATFVMFDVFSLPDDSIKGGLAAYIVRRQFGWEEPYRLDSLSRYFFLLTTCTVCYALVAIVSAPSLDLWTGYWMGDLLAVTMICPIFFLEHDPDLQALKAESVLTTAVALVIARLIFGPGEFSELSAFEYPYLLLPLMLWASLRLPDRVVAVTTIVVAALAVFYTGRGYGPFLALPVPATDQVLVLQAFLLVLTTSPVLLSLGLFERKTVSGLSRQYRQELEDSEDTYRLLFETSAVAIAVLQERSLIQMNRALLRLFQLETEDDLLALAPPAQPNGRPSSEVADELYKSSREQTVSTVWTARASGGHEFDLDITMFGLPSTDRVIFTAIDVTKSNQLLKMLEKERASLAARVELRSTELVQANAALTRSVRAKQEFVAHLSHELKTPLTSLIAQSDTLLEELFGPLTPDQNKAIIDLRDNGERLSRLIIDLLEIHRLEMGMVKPSLKSVELEKIIDDVFERCQLVQQRRDLTFTRETENVTLSTDPDLLKRVLGLLLGRAARQSEIGGSFGMKTEIWSDLHRLEVTIWDTGPELPKKVFQNMDDPYNVRSEDTERAETGLTLALVSKLMNLLSGELAGRSSRDGTLVTASFPLGEQ